MWNNVDLCFSRNMTGKKSSTEHCLFIIVATIFCLISPCTPIISDKRLCYDPDCSVAIGTAKTLSNYHSNDPHILSFRVNDDVEIFSKGAGSRKDLWGVEIAGKRGYAPSMFLIEKKTTHKDLAHEVPTPEYEQPVPELSPDVREIDVSSVDGSGMNEPNIVAGVKSSTDLTNNESLQPSPQQVSPSFEVIDGTTFNLSPKEEIRSESNYATEIVQGTATVSEQPVLTVHPNLESSEVMLQKNILDEATVHPSEVSNQPPVQSEFPHTVNEESHSEIPNPEEYPHPPENEQVMHIIADESTTINVKEEAPFGFNENVGIPVENIVQDQKYPLNEELQPEHTEFIASTDNNQPADLPSANVQTEDRTDSPAIISEQEPAQESPYVTQPHQSSPVSTEATEQTYTETNLNTVSDPTTYAFAGASETVTELYTDSSMTTEIPVTSYNIDESTQSPMWEVNEVVKDEAAIENENNREIPEDSMPIDQVYQNSIHSDTVDEITRASDNAVSDENEKMLVNVPDHTGQTGDQQLHIQEEHPNISSELETPDTISETYPDHVPNSEELPANQDSSNFENSLPEDNEVRPLDVCYHEACNNESTVEELIEKTTDDEDILIDDADTGIMYSIEYSQNYWETLSYLALTAFTTLLFSLGYYYIENTRRDGQLIAKINKLEKELLISSKECTVLDESLKSTKTKLNSIEDQSFGSNEMVVSLKTELETANKAKVELEDQVIALEKDLESATEAGLELERMLREILASNNAENSLTKSVEDLQARLNTQQSANVSLTAALHQKTQENEALSNKLTTMLQKCEQLEIEVTRKDEELEQMKETKNDMEQSSLHRIEELENQTKNLSAERVVLRKQLKGKEMEISDLLEVVKQVNTSGIDLEKLSDLSRVKADANQLLEEKEELQSKLGELEGAYHLLEEHMKIINEEMKSLSKQCTIAEKEKNDAETRLQVLSKFFKEKEEERQKEEVVWLQQQGEVSMNAERLLTVNNEIQSYKQQIDTLKREILDQEREYKNQITNLESKSHEQWVLARQSERRLEEAKAEAAQLRNRLTMIEKNLSDNDTDVKTHRLETNGETATSPTLFIGAEASSSPIMFTGSSNIPPPYLYGPPLPPFLPPHLHASSSMQGGFDVGQRPPPLGGRLSSPPPMPIASGGPPPPLPSSLHPSGGRYENSRSSPSPPLSPSMLPPFGHFRSHPPPPLPFPNDRGHPPPPVHMPPMLLPHLSNTSWGEEKITSRNNSSFHPFHRDQQPRDYTGSLVSSDESLDKTHKSGKV